MSTISKLTDKLFWEQSGNDTMATSEYSWFQEYFDEYIPEGRGKKALEIGVCPGNNLAAIAVSHGYQPYGIDILDSVAHLPGNFKSLGIDNMKSIQDDVFAWISDERYDLVMSFGFIEHFQEWPKAIDRHWELLEDQGYMIVGVPILGPLQFNLRKVTYTAEKLSEVLNTHNIEAMKLRNIEAHIKTLKGVRLIFSSHIKNMDTWIQSNDLYIRGGRGWIVRAWHKAARIPKKLGISSSFFSPYALVIAQKLG